MTVGTTHWILAGLALAAMPYATAMAQETPPEPASLKACTHITSDAQRLACYDHALGRESATARPPPDHATTTTSQTRHEAAAESQAAPNPFAPHRFSQRDGNPGSNSGVAKSAHPVSLLDSRWELDPKSKLGTFNLRAYKPVYLMPAFYTTRVNDEPSSPAPDHDVDTPLQLDAMEAKFQLSFKTKIWQGVFGDKGDVWFGYTQTSHWQVYNGTISRPFRETNYEPEALLIFATDYDLLGWKGRLLGIGINHESNGRSDPLSRSWNRIIGNIGFERPGWTIMFRPWIRIHEPRDKDDNPDIEDYLGHAQVNIVHEAGGNEYSLMLRHVLRNGERSHGAVQLTWSFPIHRQLRGYLQLFHGYGESLIDYNHEATYVGVGVSLLDWY